MRSKFLPLLIAVITTAAIANDTPFLSFKCQWGSSHLSPYYLKFNNDNAPEVAEWRLGSWLGGQKTVTFKKLNKHAAQVTIKGEGKWISKSYWIGISINGWIKNTDHRFNEAIDMRLTYLRKNGELKQF